MGDVCAVLSCDGAPCEAVLYITSRKRDQIKLTSRTSIFRDKDIGGTEIRNAYEYSWCGRSVLSRRGVEGDEGDANNITVVSRGIRRIRHISSWRLLRLHTRKRDSLNLPVFVKEETFDQDAPKFVDFHNPLPDRAPKNSMAFMLGSTARRFKNIELVRKGTLFVLNLPPRPYHVQACYHRPVTVMSSLSHILTETLTLNGKGDGVNV